MDNNRMQSKQRKTSPKSMMWLYGIVVTGLASVSNLVLFLILQTYQMLAVSAGAILCAGIFLVARQLEQKNRFLLSAVVASAAWGIFCLIHGSFWEGVSGILIAGAWLLAALIFLGLPTGIGRFFVFLPSLVSTILILVLEISSPLERLLVTEFATGRIIAPIYFFLFGILLFLISLRGFQTQNLATRMIASLTMIVFILIGILSMVTYSITKSNYILSAANSLDQTAFQKSGKIEDWSLNLSNSLADILGTVDSYSKITELINSHARGSINIELFYRQTVANILIESLGESGFEEIILLDSNGTVLTSTRGDLIGADYRYSEFFWQGKLDVAVISPRYYPLEDEVSIFFSRPVYDYTGQVIGVISGRTTVEKMIAIVAEPDIQPYRTTSAYLINTDGTLLFSSEGRPELHLITDGAQTLLSTHLDGSDSYTNIDGLPIIGVYHWLPDLNVGIVVEVTEAEVFQRIPGIISGNLAIGAAAFVLAILAALVIVRSITNPINNLVSAAQDVIAGNLETQVEIDRDDEIGILSAAFNQMTRELKVLVSGLETRVAERTHDLEQRSIELQTAAQIARDASLATDIDELLDRTCRLIRERFGFYHVGIFLNDDNNEFAVLRAAGGDAGKLMLSNKHKLKIGEMGIVGSVAKSGEPRIALDVGADSVHFRNPLLPYTRSEMALPLKIIGHVIGILDVQSDKINAFDQNDITIMSILTDQLAIAIERTRLLQESRQNSAALELSLQSQTSRTWREYLNRPQQARGYRYEGVQIEALDKPNEAMLESLNSGIPVNTSKKIRGEGSLASIPVRLRGQTLGVINIEFSSDDIPANTMHLLEEAANRLSLALENARLVQDTQRLASQEQQINLISGQIQQSTNFETIIQNTIRELGKTLGAPKTFIQIGLTSPPQKDNV